MDEDKEIVNNTDMLTGHHVNNRFFPNGYFSFMMQKRSVIIKNMHVLEKVSYQFIALVPHVCTVALHVLTPSMLVFT
jgi:hypothetical protein